MITKTQIAELSGLHLSKVQYYMKNFSEYFEGHKVSGQRWEVYDKEAVEKVKIIADNIKDHNHDEIKTMLDDAGYSPVFEMTTQSISIADKGITTAIEINSLLHLVDVQRQIIDYQKRVIDDLLDKDKDS